MKTYIVIAFFGLFILGTSCNKDKDRISVLGSWNCEEYSEIGQRIYQANIMRNPYMPEATNEYIINNFHKLGLTESTEVYVREEEPGVLTITGSAALDISFIGSGILAEDFSKIEWRYQVNDGGSNPLVMATYY